MKWPSAKEEVIIRLLVDGELFGLSLVEKSNGLLKKGTVFVTLGRMGQKGLLESRQEPREHGIPRRYYKLSAAGEKFLLAFKLMS